MLQFTGLQKVGHDLATEQQRTAHINIYYMLHIVYIYIIYKHIFQGVTASNFKFGDDHFKKFVKKKKEEEIHVHIAMTWPESFCFSQYTSEAKFYFILFLMLGLLYMKRKWKWKSLIRVQLFATPWTIQSMEFSRPEYWSG